MRAFIVLTLSMLLISGCATNTGLATKSSEKVSKYSISILPVKVDTKDINNVYLNVLPMFGAEPSSFKKIQDELQLIAQKLRPSNNAQNMTIDIHIERYYQALGGSKGGALAKVTWTAQSARDVVFKETFYASTSGFMFGVMNLSSKISDAAINRIKERMLYLADGTTMSDVLPDTYSDEKSAVSVLPSTIMEGGMHWTAIPSLYHDPTDWKGNTGLHLHPSQVSPTWDLSSSNNKDQAQSSSSRTEVGEAGSVPKSGDQTATQHKSNEVQPEGDLAAIAMSSDIPQKLRELQKLRNENVITESEYKQKKEELLKRY